MHRKSGNPSFREKLSTKNAEPSSAADETMYVVDDCPTAMPALSDRDEQDFDLPDDSQRAAKISVPPSAKNSKSVSLVNSAMKNESNLLDMRAVLGETEVIDGNDYVSQNYMLNQQSFENESFLLDITQQQDPIANGFQTQREK